MIRFPVVPLLVAELALTLASWSWAVRRMSGSIRWPALGGTVIGIIAGIGFWIAGLGPLLLP